MPWRIRRLWLLLLCAVVALAIAAVVLARNRSADDELLASGLLVGGVAIALVALPTNGGEK